MIKIEQYLTQLQEEFNPSIEIASIKSDMNEQWTDCFDTRCDRMDVSHERKECKAECIINAANRAASRISTLTGQCNEAKNPVSCLKTLRSAVEQLRDKVDKAREDQAKARDQEAKFRRKEAGGV